MENVEELVKKIYAVRGMQVKPIDVLKANLLRVAAHHREHCPGAECNITLYYLLTLGERAGLTFTPEEKVLFI